MNYRELKKLNQSILKKILISPKEYLRAKEKQEQGEQSIAPHFVFGSVVDIMLVGSKDEFEEKFVRIPDETKCSDAVKTIVDGVVAEMLELGSSLIDRDIILRHCNNISYYNNWKDDTRIDKILVDGKDYFELLKTTAGKTPITESEYAKAVGCVMALKSDKFTKPYVDKKHDKDVEFWDKFIIEFDYKGFAMKGELDRVCINHKDKTITPIDFKTTGKPITGFQYEFFTYRYDFQATVYSWGLFQHPKVKELIDKDYVVQDFLYIVVETNLFNEPMIFEVGEEVMTIGFHGGTLSNGRKLEGFSGAINRLQYALDTNNWKFPMEYYLNEGKLNIEV